jgi:ribosomal protection tetracycline resistance protein
MQIVNIGILAHVDAGKTSLTERLLYDAGVIDRLGSVDAGTTQTDTGELERRRGITIRSAVVGFTVGDRRVNLIDTPGHSDFVAEVERALGVLDGAVLVLSAVEGVQPHTRVLMRILRDLRLPTLIFVNKIDRTGARPEALLADIARLLTPQIAPLGMVRGAGTADADYVPHRRDDPAVRSTLAAVLAEHDEALLADLVDGVIPRWRRLRSVLRAQIAAAEAYPLMFGCALSGAGVGALRGAIGDLLPPAPAPEERLRARVFAIERGPGGEKIAYLRSYGGHLQPRQRVTVHRRGTDGRIARFGGQVSGLQVVGGPAGAGQRLATGEIGRIRGLPGLRIGDQVGSPEGLAGRAHFARPALETVVLPRRPQDAGALHAALLALADTDPLIGTRIGADGRSSLLLYGEVQKEVVAATLAEAYGIEAEFLPSRPVLLERPVGSGTGHEPIGHGFAAELGLRVGPAPAGAGVRYRREVELGSLPPAFHRAIEETVGAALEQGRYGWPVVDVDVTVTHCGYWSPVTAAGDFRDLTPLVLAQALAAAGTRVHEPCHRFEVEVPADRLGPVTARLAQLGARIDETTTGAGPWRLTGDLPARAVHAIQRALPGLSGGEGTWTSRPQGDRPLAGAPPRRPRTDGNPFDRTEYLRFLAQRTLGTTSGVSRGTPAPGRSRP